MAVFLENTLPRWLHGNAPSLAPETDLPVPEMVRIPTSEVGRKGSRPSRNQFSVQQPSLLPGLPVPIHTLATHQDSHGHLHQPTTPRPVSKAKRSWMLFGEVCFLEECSIAGRFWGLERKTDSNTLMASSADSKNPLPTQSSPAAPPPYSSPASPTGKGLSTSQLEARPTGLSCCLRETHFLLRQATDGSVTLAQAPGDLPQKPPISLAPPSTWHLKRIGRHHPRSLEALVSRDKFYEKEKSHW